MFAIVDPRIDLICEFLLHIGQNSDFAVVEIPYDAKLPDILWKFHCICGNDLHIMNPHFYPSTLFEEEVFREVLPLGDRNGRSDEKWTEIVSVYGDSKDGPIKLTSKDGTVQRVFAAVTQCLGRVTPLSVFKGLTASWGNSLVFTHFL